jgi:hypothetical protein
MSLPCLAVAQRHLPIGQRQELVRKTGHDEKAGSPQSWGRSPTDTHSVAGGCGTEWVRMFESALAQTGDVRFRKPSHLTDTRIPRRN